MADEIEACAMDCGNGDRGDVAPAAGHMPVAMDSRCRSCGSDLSVRDAARAGFCEMCDGQGQMAMGDSKE